MKQENNYLFKADEGKTFIRKADVFVMGTGLCLGDDDSIENYDEVELTEENDIEGILKKDEAKKKYRR